MKIEAALIHHRSQNLDRMIYFCRDKVLRASLTRNRFNIKQLEVIMEPTTAWQRRISPTTLLSIQETKGRSTKRYVATVKEFIKFGRVDDLEAPLEAQVMSAWHNLQNENNAVILISEAA